MFKKFVPAFMLLVLMFSFSSTSQKAFAEDGVSPLLNGNEATYTYWLQSTKTLTGTTYGNWATKGSTFLGPGTFNPSFETTTGFSITATGGLPIKGIEAGLELGLTKETKLTTSASRYISAGKVGEFQVRDEYKHYSVKMEEWFSLDGRKSKTGTVKYVTIKQKVGIQSQILMK